MNEFRQFAEYKININYFYTHAQDNKNMTFKIHLQ